MTHLPPGGPDLTVPEHCAAGHELLPRTTIVESTRRRGQSPVPTSWTCSRCLRISLWRQWKPANRTAEPPGYLNDEDQYSRLQELRSSYRRSVRFASGWQYDDPDPTPELRAGRRARRDAEDRERWAMEEAEADRQRRARLRNEAEQATARIRAAMNAARCGTAVA